MYATAKYRVNSIGVDAEAYYCGLAVRRWKLKCPCATIPSLHTQISAMNQTVTAQAQCGPDDRETARVPLRTAFLMK